MGALKIKMAEMPLLEHLQRGGKVDDQIGQVLVSEFVVFVMADETIAAITRDHKLEISDVAQIVRHMNQAFPDPRIFGGGPMLVSTLFFMEPQRFRKLAFNIDWQIARLGEEKRRFAIMQTSMIAAEEVWTAHNSSAGRRVLRRRYGVIGCVVAAIAVLTFVFMLW